MICYRLWAENGIRLSARYVILKKTSVFVEERFLKRKNNLGVEYRSWLLWTSIDLLLNVSLELIALLNGANHVDSLSLGKHCLKEQILVNTWQILLIASVSWNDAGILYWKSYFFLRMIIWTMLFLALDLHPSRFTLQSLVIEVVILFLFPAVTAIAAIVEFASIGISFCLISGMPKSALNASIIFKDMRLSAEVLPIVSVLALVS